MRYTSKKDFHGLSLFLFLSFALFVVPVVNVVNAEPTTIVVPDDYSTIQEAINNAVDGDTVYVRSGVYFEHLYIGKSISLVGENKESTTIYRGNQSYPNVYPTVVVRKDAVNISGFTIKNDISYPNEIDIRYYPGAIESMTGLHLIDVQHCNIFENIITDSGYGIWLYDSKNNSLSDNTITNSNHGLLLDHSANNTMSRNIVSHCNLGIVLSSAQLNIFRDNIMLNSSRNFVISGTTTVHYNNYFYSSNWVNGKRMFYMFNLTNVELSSSHFPDAGLVYIVNCDNLKLRNLDVSNDYGLFLFNTTNSEMASNNISNSTIGVWVDSCYNVTISKNYLNSIRADAVRIQSSEKIMVEENFVEQTSGNGIRLVSSYNSTIVRNVLEENINYGVHLESSSNNTIAFNELTNSQFGITLVSSPQNKIETNSISSHNFATANLTRAIKGISLSGKSNNTEIAGNTVTNCEWGVLLESSLLYYVNITGNNFTKCNIGLELRGFKSTYTANTISNSDEFAVVFSYGLSNVFYNNNFLNNSQQINPITVNFWNNTVNGNYWSDYNGIDSNNDGIGDTPYVIDDRNQDNHPLMFPVRRFDAGVWEWTQYGVDVVSNFNVSNFSFEPENNLIQFSVDGETGATGFCRVTIPKELMAVKDNNWLVFFAGGAYENFTINEDTSNTYLYFNYNYTTKLVEIFGTTTIPEFPSWAILPFLLFASLVVVVCRKKLTKAF